MRVHPLPFVALSVLALALGCSDGTGPKDTEPRVGPPAKLAQPGGTDQQAVAGGTVPDSLTVRVTDANGTPVPGTPVAWAVSAGGGSLSPTTATTNAAGEAKSAWTLGATAGANVATATVQGLSPVRFTATGTAGAPAQFAKVRGDSQTGTVGSALPDSLVVRIADGNGNPVAGATVTWTVASGGGAVSPPTALTNGAGEAKTVWTLGTAAGENTLVASVGGLPAQTFVARATPGAPAELAKVSGDGQTATVGGTLSDSLVVRLTDRHGNAVGGVAVVWGATGGGQITPASSQTNPAGVAKASWQLGSTVGTQMASAGVGTTLRVDFTATAAAAPTPPAPEPAEPADPGPGPTIRLNPPEAVGGSVFAVGNTAQGGQGDPVSGVTCITTIKYHEHVQVSLFVEGRQIAIPGGIGIEDPKRSSRGYTTTDPNGCFYELHTHDASGIVHVEPSTDRRLTLGQLFDVWGRPLTSGNVAGFEGPVRVYIDGERFEGDPRLIEFTRHKQVTLQVGTPLAPIPSYIFPTGL